MITTPTRKKIHSKIIEIKRNKDVKRSDAKDVHKLRDKIARQNYATKLRDKTVVSFIYNFHFIDYFSFASFIVDFTFFASNQMENWQQIAYGFGRILHTAHSINRRKSGYNLTFNFFKNSFLVRTTAQKMKLSISYIISKCDKIPSFLAQIY